MLLCSQIEGRAFLPPSVAEGGTTGIGSHPVPVGTESPGDIVTVLLDELVFDVRVARQGNGRFMPQILSETTHMNISSSTHRSKLGNLQKRVGWQFLATSLRAPEANQRGRRILCKS